MKFMITLGDEFSCNETAHEPIYVDGTNETQDDSSLVADDSFTVDDSFAAAGSSTDSSFVNSTRTSKQMRKACRNSGKAYVTSSGKCRPEKKVTPLTECRAKCNTRFTFEMQQAIFNEYWSLGSYDRRAAFVSSMITVSDKKSFRPRTYEAEKEKFRMKTYGYSLEINGERLPTCKGCFLKTLDESEGIVKTVAMKKRACPTGSLLSDMRGKHSPRHRDDVHIIPARSTLPFYC